MRILFAVALLAPAALAADRNFDRTLSVSTAPTLVVETGSGTIRLHAGSDAQVHVEARLRASEGWFDRSGDLEERLQRIANNPPVEQKGNLIIIGRSHGFDTLGHNVTIDYDIALPRASTITAKTGSGNIDVEDVGVSLKANTGSGSIGAHGIRGPASLETGSGNIELAQAASGDVRAETGSGSIHLSGVAGGLRATTGSGSLTIAGRPSTDWRLESGSGSIHIDLGSSTRFTLDASTSSGAVHVEQPITMQGAIDRRHVSGTVNGGGPRVRAETGSGNIDIR